MVAVLGFLAVAVLAFLTTLPIPLMVLCNLGCVAFALGFTGLLWGCVACKRDTTKANAKKHRREQLERMQLKAKLRRLAGASVSDAAGDAAGPIPGLSVQIFHCNAYGGSNRTEHYRSLSGVTLNGVEAKVADASATRAMEVHDYSDY